MFIDEVACKIITASFNYCHAHKVLRIHAYVIMLNHLHALLFDADFDSTRLKRTLDGFRKFTGRQLLDLGGQYRPASFMEGFRKHAGKDRERRLWQPTQHPEGITSEKFYLQKLNYIHDNPRRKGLVGGEGRQHARDWRRKTMWCCLLSVGNATCGQVSAGSKTHAEQSGGTESIMLAVKTARDKARAERPHIKEPEMVLPKTAHAAFHKAAYYLSVKPVLVDVNPATFKVRAEDMEKAITGNTILLVVSAPNYSQGVIDPIDEIGTITQKHNL